MFSENPFIVNHSKLVNIFFPLGIVPNTKIYFPTDGFLSSRKITGLSIPISGLPTAAMQFNGNSVTNIGANYKYFTVTLMEKGTGKILIEQSPAAAFIDTATTQNRPFRRLNNLNVSFQDSYITFIAPGIGIAQTTMFFNFYYD